MLIDLLSYLLRKGIDSGSGQILARLFAHG
jgi:hypothetical protein